MFTRITTRFALGLLLAGAAGAAVAQDEGSEERNQRQMRQLESQLNRQLQQYQRMLPGNSRIFRVEPGQGFRQVDPRLFSPEADRSEPVLGLTLRPAPDVLRAHLDLPEGAGLVVDEVAEDSPAAGLIERNDVLLSIAPGAGAEPTSLKEPGDLAEVFDRSDGEAVGVRLLRGGEEQTVEVPTARPALEGERRYRIGVAITTPDDAVRAQLGMPEGTGVVVTAVQAESAAEEAGLRPNDILVEIDGEAIESAEALSDQVQESEGEAVALSLIRDGEERTIRVTPVAVPAEPAETVEEGPMQFFGPGVIISPEEAERLREVFPPGRPGQPALRMPIMPGVPNLERQLDELREQVETLRKEVEKLREAAAEHRSGRDHD